MIQTSRWLPLWAMIPILLVYLGLCVLAAQSSNALVFLPFLAFGGYVIALGLCNSTSLTINQSGIKKLHGPLPAGVANLNLAADNIVCCSYEHFWAARSQMQTYNCYATVQTKDGMFHKVFGPFGTVEEARFGSQRIADALAAGSDKPPVPIVDSGFVAPKGDLKLALAILCFALIAIAAFVATLWFNTQR